MKMSRQKKLFALIVIVTITFTCAYAWHRYLAGKFEISGRMQSKEAKEISGITASAVNQDVFYIHNDSGDTSRIFAINNKGELLSTIYYNWGNGGIAQHDCEDISTGPGPVKGASYIYVADIGDNSASRNFVNIFRIKERAALIGKKTVGTKATAVHLVYPDGPKDAEAFMVDPVDRLMYIITKRYDSVTVYTAPLAFKANDTLKLTKRCRLFFQGLKPLKWITAADVSKDGRQVLVKNYQKVFYWRRETDEALWQTLQRKPLELPYQQEKLGEAVGFMTGGKGYLTTSEGVYAPIYYYKTPGYF
ncbi:hypothetical protein [Mucilaginibacter defluvii]